MVAIPLDKINYNKVSKYANVLNFKEFYPKTKNVSYCLKANMNSYIQLQTAAIFFLSSLYLKQGIDSVYVMVGFICKG